MKKISLYLMTEKGLTVIKTIIEKGYTHLVDKVIIAHDKNVVNDYYQEMWDASVNAGLDTYDKTDNPEITSAYALTIMWRWMLPIKEGTTLLVTHDSLLPRYRGFAPLVNGIINREPYIGVSALLASEEFDRGDIIAQKSAAVTYPIKIEDAIALELPLFAEIVTEIFSKLDSDGEITATPQDESKATYSVWRDEEDYRIDWTKDADYLQQFIFSVGYPYKGASTTCDGQLLRIIDCEVMDDVIVENRAPGKLLFMIDGYPVIICGKGLLKLTMVADEQGNVLEKMPKYRMRLK